MFYEKFGGSQAWSLSLLANQIVPSLVEPLGLVVATAKEPACSESFPWLSSSELLNASKSVSRSSQTSEVIRLQSHMRIPKVHRFLLLIAPFMLRSC